MLRLCGLMLSIFIHSFRKRGWNSFVLLWFTFEHEIFYRNTHFASNAREFKRHYVSHPVNTLKTHTSKSNGFSYAYKHSTVKINYNLLHLNNSRCFFSALFVNNRTVFIEFSYFAWIVFGLLICLCFSPLVFFLFLWKKFQVIWIWISFFGPIPSTLILKHLE